MPFSTLGVGADVAGTYAIDTTKPEYPAAPFAVGQRVTGSDNSEYVFVKNAASTALAAGDVCYLVITTFAATKLSTSNDARGNIVAVAVSAIPGTTGTITGYGWMQVKGQATASVLASAAANVRLNTTATAGSLDDDGTAGSMQVQGLYLSAANGGSTAATACILNYPYVDVTL